MGKGSKALQPQTVEVAAMFIRHCPEKDLSLMFLSKPQTMWTACEVQSQLDEFLRSRAGKVGHVSQHTTLTATPVSGAVVSSVPTGESTVGVGKLGSVCLTVTHSHALPKQAISTSGGSRFLFTVLFLSA